MKICFAALIAAVLSNSQASALPIKSTSFPDSKGYIKVIVQPDQTLTDLDLLFVVDNSGSMDPHQTNLSANVTYLLDELKSFPGSINAGVITTDMEDPLQRGRMTGTPAVLNSADSDFLSTLRSRLMVGTNGSAFERHFDATVAALTEPLINGPNKGFLRAKSALNVVLISDEDDQSQITEQDFAQFIRNLEGQRETHIFGIIPKTCTPMSGDRIPHAIAAANGETEDLCSPDWAGKLKKIGRDIGAYTLRSVRLPTEPVLETIEVKFGSRILVGGNLAAGWSYDRKQMTVLIGQEFDFHSQPPGTELEIRFVPKYWQ